VAPAVLGTAHASIRIQQSSKL